LPNHLRTSWWLPYLGNSFDLEEIDAAMLLSPDELFDTISRRRKDGWAPRRSPDEVLAGFREAEAHVASLSAAMRTDAEDIDMPDNHDARVRAAFRRRVDDGDEDTPSSTVRLLNRFGLSREDIEYTSSMLPAIRAATRDELALSSHSRDVDLHMALTEMNDWSVYGTQDNRCRFSSTSTCHHHVTSVC
jgi:hypothetical protein